VSKETTQLRRTGDGALERNGETAACGHLLSARNQVLISPSDWQRYSSETIEVRKMIYGYRKKLLQGDEE